MTRIALPPPPFLGALLFRAAGLWLLLRAGVLAVGLLLELATAAELIWLTGPAAGWLVLLTAWLTLFDARRRRELLFLADLGVAPLTALILAALPPILAEVAVRLSGPP